LQSLETPLGACDRQEPQTRIAPEKYLFLLFLVRSCLVSTLGKNGELHQAEIEATRLFDAADQAIKNWNPLWWFSDSDISIQCGESNWCVSQASVREWRLRRTSPVRHQSS
jgi:hypothetical protein